VISKSLRIIGTIRYIYAIESFLLNRHGTIVNVMANTG